MFLILLWALVSTVRAADVGVVPTSPRGVALNLGFEAGTLQDWHAEGAAFAGMPVAGDAVAKRRSDMKSGHDGRFLVGSFERGGDAPKGRLTSVAFVLSKPFASFLIAGGSTPNTRAEIVRVDTGAVLAHAAGDGTEELKRVAFDLTPHVGKEVFVRLIDDASEGWGHINFDDFRLHDTKPATAGCRAVTDEHYVGRTARSISGEDYDPVIRIPKSSGYGPGVPRPSLRYTGLVDTTKS